MSRLLLLALLAAPLPASASSIAEVVCAPRDKMLQKLQTQFGETMQSQGLRDPDSVIEIWTSDERRTWTMVMAYTDGRSCIVAMGSDWTPMQPVDPA